MHIFTFTLSSRLADRRGGPRPAAPLCLPRALAQSGCVLPPGRWCARRLQLRAATEGVGGGGGWTIRIAFGGGSEPPGISTRWEGLNPRECSGKSWPRCNCNERGGEVPRRASQVRLPQRGEMPPRLGTREGFGHGMELLVAVAPFTHCLRRRFRTPGHLHELPGNLQRKRRETRRACCSLGGVVAGCGVWPDALHSSSCGNKVLPLSFSRTWGSPRPEASSPAPGCRCEPRSLSPRP